MCGVCVREVVVEMAVRESRSDSLKAYIAIQVMPRTGAQSTAF